MKRGEVSVQLNWMFVLFVGGLLLVLVFGVVGKTKGNAQVRVEGELLDRLAGVLVNAQVSPNTNKPVEIAKQVELTLECSLQSQRIRIGDASSVLDSQIVFGPKIIHGPQLLTLSRSIEWPFHIDNIVYLTSPKVYYLVMGDDQLASDILGLLPQAPPNSPAQTKARVPVSSSLPTNIPTYDEIRVILTQPSPLPSIPQEFKSYRQRLSLVAFDVSDQDAPGKVRYYVQNAVSGSWLARGSSLGEDVLSMPSIIAAAVASGPDDYKCGMERLWKRTNLVANVLYARSLNLTQSYGGLCGATHQAASVSLHDLMDATSSDFVVNNVERVAVVIAELEGYNGDAVRNSCARIY